MPLTCRSLAGAALALALAVPAPAKAQAPTPAPAQTLGPPPAPRACEIPRFRGITLPGGVETTMRVVAGSGPCRITYFLDPERGEPFASARLAIAPQHGTVELGGSSAAYLPAPGFTGTDSFTIQTAGTVNGRPITGQVTVRVTVLPRP